MASDLHASLNVYNLEPEQLARVIEVMSRAAAGLALDGIGCSLSTGLLRDEDS